MVRMNNGRRPRIVLATDSHDPSGLGAHMLTLGRALAPQFEIIVAAMAEGGGRGLLARAARHGLAVRQIDDTQDFGSWLARSGASLLHVHAGIGWEGHALAAAGKAAGLPVIRTEHLPYLLTDADQEAHFRAAIAEIDRMIVVSDASRQSFDGGRIDPAKLTVVRNGVLAGAPGMGRDEILADLGLTGRKILLTVARFSLQKDHATLIAAMSQIVADHPDVLLLLVGTGSELETVGALVAQLGLTQHVQFLGQRDDVAALMAAADLFVLPSRFEGLPLAVLEAMAAGLAVVATRIGGTLEALGDDHPHLVEPGDAAGLARNVIALLHDPLAARALGEAQQQRFLTDFQAERMAAETQAIYRQFLQSDSMQGHQFMDKTRIGFIGVGGIAHRHLDILAGFEDVELVAFADPDFGRAEDAARKFGARAFDNHKEMLEAQELDAVYICIPPFAHGEAERDVIARNIPFFVEKPVSLDIDLADELAALIAEKNLITGVGYHWRYLDTVEEARRILADNPAQLLSGYWLDQTPPPQWWWKADKSGGQMVEQTTHIIDLARYLVGDVTRVYGMASHKPRGDFPDLDVPTASTASLSFASGAIGNIGSTCILRWGHHVGLNIFADGLAIELTDHDIMVDVGAGRPVRRAEGDPVWHEDRDFVDAVRGGENRIRCPYHEAVETHRVALAVNQSAQSGQSISFAKS